MFSVVMAVRNGMPHLEETVESVLTQSHEGFELIIVDDGSSDSTHAYLSSLSDSRLRMFQTTGIGQGPALNYGVAQSSATWIVRLDADDPMHPQRLEALAMHVQDLVNDCGILASRASIIHGDNKASFSCFPSSKIENAENHDVTGELAYHNPAVHSAVAIRRDAFTEVNGFSPTVTSNIDYWLWGRIVERGWKFRRIELQLQAKRLHANQAFERGQRLKYLTASAKAQYYCRTKALGLSRTRMWFLCSMKFLYGSLPQCTRSRLLLGR